MKTKTPFWKVVSACAAALITTACGGSEDSTADGPGSGEETRAPAALFPDAPTCAAGELLFTGTLDGLPLLDSPFGVSNLEPSTLSAGMGPITADGASFGYALEAHTDSRWRRGEKVPFAVANIWHSYYYVGGDHPLADQYLCITAGEIAPLEEAPEGHVVFQWHITGLKKGLAPVSADNPPGFDCGGADVTADIYGCLDRTTPYFP